MDQVLHPVQRQAAPLGDTHIIKFLTFLATKRNVSAGTQALALNAIVFLKTKFLGQPIGDLSGFSRSERQRKLPVVLTRAEISSLLAAVNKVHYLMVALLYGSGLRRIELVRLRVKDIDFDYRQVRVINGKGGRHRLVTLADELLPLLRAQISRVEGILNSDREARHYAGVWLPDALTCIYTGMAFSVGWHSLVPALAVGAVW